MEGGICQDCLAIWSKEEKTGMTTGNWTLACTLWETTSMTVSVGALASWPETAALWHSWPVFDCISSAGDKAFWSPTKAYGEGVDGQLRRWRKIQLLILKGWFWMILATVALLNIILRQNKYSECSSMWRILPLHNVHFLKKAFKATMEGSSVKGLAQSQS